MYGIQFSAAGMQFGNVRGRAGRIGARRPRQRISETQRELRALVCYLRQQESAVLDAMQRLQDGM